MPPVSAWPGGGIAQLASPTSAPVTASGKNIPAEASDNEEDGRVPREEDSEGADRRGGRDDAGEEALVIPAGGHGRYPSDDICFSDYSSIAEILLGGEVAVRREGGRN